MTKQTTSDHDLLIRVDSRLSDLITTVNDIRDGTSVRIASLEKEKADRKELQIIQDKVNNDIEKRVTSLESTKADFREQIGLTNQSNANLKYYLVLMSGIGVLLIGMVIWQMTGYHI